MPQAKSSVDLNVRGELIADAPIGAQSWFRCGGTADLLFQPADEDDLIAFLKQWPQDEPLTFIGGMANMIVRDGGVRGAVVRLGKAFSDIAVDGQNITVGAGALNGSVASRAAKAGVAGLEFLSGIPGSMGGALAMNAGAYGAEVKDVFVKADVVLRTGEKISVRPRDLKMTYRHTRLPQGAIVTKVYLKGHPSKEKEVREMLRNIKEKRNATQPIREDTGGSTFANPKGELRAWEVVEKVGGRGLKIGGAQMSEKHCNFMINTGDATASDLEALGDELIHRAKEQLNIDLRWEIKRIGER